MNESLRERIRIAEKMLSEPEGIVEKKYIKWNKERLELQLRELEMRK